jgi:MFS family permease
MDVDTPKTAAIRVVGLCGMLNNIFNLSVYPYVQMMMMDFGLVDGRSETGYYSCAIISAFFLGRGLLASVWGCAIDHHGRKFGLVAALAASTLFIIAFGFSTSLIWAVASRFLLGVCSSFPGTTSTIMSELA